MHKHLAPVDPLSRGYTVTNNFSPFAAILLVRLNTKLSKLKSTDTIKINGEKNA